MVIDWMSPLKTVWEQMHGIVTPALTAVITTLITTWIVDRRAKKKARRPWATLEAIAGRYTTFLPFPESRLPAQSHGHIQLHLKSLVDENIEDVEVQLESVKLVDRELGPPNRVMLPWTPNPGPFNDGIQWDPRTLPAGKGWHFDFLMLEPRRGFDDAGFPDKFWFPTSATLLEELKKPGDYIIALSAVAKGRRPVSFEITLKWTGRIGTSSLVLHRLDYPLVPEEAHRVAS